jgi:hypothetical protein
MKCTRQRCQEACSTWAIAAFNPSCASEMTSLTSRKPRLLGITRRAYATENHAPAPCVTRPRRTPMSDPG